MKVFLSHSTKDKDFVEKLAGDIHAANIEPWLCEVDVLYGDDFVTKIEKGLKEADVTVLIWSPDAAISAWTGNEWRSVLDRETKESRTRLGLVLLRDADFPELLRTKHYIDGRSDAAKAIQQTVVWLERLRNMRRFEESKAASFLLDFDPKDFIGRTSYLEQLQTALVEEQGKFLLWGEAGSGKSMLALKFAWRAQGAFDAVVFQHCGQRSAEEIGVELAGRIGLDVKELAPDQQIAEAKRWLSARRTLFLLDDIWDIDVKELIPAPPLSVRSLSVLCTSRRRSLPWIKRPRSLEVKSFSEEEAESLFSLYLGQETATKHEDSLLKLAERFERLPIAVAVAAEMLASQFGPLDEGTQALKLDQLRTEIHDVPELFQHAITSQPAQDQSLLQAMAVCHPDGFWFPLAADISGLNKAERSESRDRLVNTSLVRPCDREQQRFRLHALLREQLLVSAPVEQLQNKYTSVLYEPFEDWENGWRDCQECLSEVIPAIQMLRHEGSINQAVSLAYWGFATAHRVGELDAALRILEEEEKFWENREDPDAKDSLQISYGNQALILKDWGQLEEAMALHKKQEALCIELGNRSSLGYCYWNWGLLAREQQDRNTERGKLKEALQIFTKLNMPREREAVQHELTSIDKSD